MATKRSPTFNPYVVMTFENQAMDHFWDMMVTGEFVKHGGMGFFVGKGATKTQGISIWPEDTFLLSEKNLISFTHEFKPEGSEGKWSIDIEIIDPEYTFETKLLQTTQLGAALDNELLALIVDGSA